MLPWSKGSMVYLNDSLVIQGPRDDATASFGFQMHQAEGSQFLIEDFSVADNGKTGRQNRQSISIPYLTAAAGL